MLKSAELWSEEIQRSKPTAVWILFILKKYSGQLWNQVQNDIKLCFYLYVTLNCGFCTLPSLKIQWIFEREDSWSEAKCRSSEDIANSNDSEMSDLSEWSNNPRGFQSLKILRYCHTGDRLTKLILRLFALSNKFSMTLRCIFPLSN